MPKHQEADWQEVAVRRGRPYTQFSLVPAEIVGNPEHFEANEGKWEVERYIPLSQVRARLKDELAWIAESKMGAEFPDWDGGWDSALEEFEGRLTRLLAALDRAGFSEGES